MRSGAFRCRSLLPGRMLSAPACMVPQTPAVTVVTSGGTPTVSAPHGTLVTIVGAGFGGTSGTVTFGGSPAVVSAWGNNAVTVFVPASTGSQPILLTNAAGNPSSSVPFTVT